MLHLNGATTYIKFWYKTQRNYRRHFNIVTGGDLSKLKLRSIQSWD